MKRYGSKAVFVMLLITFLLGLDRASAAMESPVDWFDHEFGSSNVVVHLAVGEEKTLLMDGLLKFAYPHGFQVHYLSRTAPVTITSQDGFVQVQTGSDAQYGYDRFWLFQDIQDYLFALAEFSRVPVEFSGMDKVADRRARRYIGTVDPQFVLWCDEESGLPFLVRQDQRTFVTVTSYIIENGVITSVDLELSFGPGRAFTTLTRGLEGWVPSRLEIEDSRGQVQMELSNWSFPMEWRENPLPRLAALSELNDLFLEEFAAKDFHAALDISQEMLALAPQFWQVYLYQAFAYEGLDNFLGVVENYQQVLMRQPNHHLALNNLAYHYFLREVQIVQALELAERAVQLDRKDTYLDTLGYGYYLVGRYHEAKELLVEALETASGDAAAEIAEHLDLVLKALGEE